MSGQGRREKAASEGYDSQGGIERGRERHHEVASHHNERAKDHRGSLAKPAVGDYSARQWCQKDGRDVGAVYERCLALRYLKFVDHIVDEKSSHSVERELLPDVCQEEDGQPARMADQSFAEAAFIGLQNVEPALRVSLTSYLQDPSGARCDSPKSHRDRIPNPQIELRISAKTPTRFPLEDGAPAST